MSRMADSHELLTKDVIDGYRRTPMTTMALLLDYHGPARWKGAFDMVMELRGCSYQDAVTFLHEHMAGGMGDNQPKTSGWVEALTPQERAVKAEWRQQLTALAADRYRLTMFHCDERRTYRAGKHKGETEELFFTAEQLLGAVQETSRRNWQRDYNVYVTPFSDALTYFLIDDVMPEAKSRMDASGFRPLLLQQTSWHSWQAVLAVPKSDLGDDPERRLANLVFQRLNQTYGDAGIGGQIHPFRAAGFQNRKPKYLNADGRYPTVHVIDTHPGLVCAATREFVREIAATAPAVRARPTGAAGAAQDQLSEAGRAKIASCQARTGLVQYAQDSYERLAERYGSDLDASRADFKIAIGLLHRGASLTEAIAVLLATTSDMRDRPHYRDPEGYMLRSVLAAAKVAA
jgi:hypothetical protein